MNVLILGAGGREHALAWKIAQSPLLDKLFVAPGNAGTQLYNAHVDTNDFGCIASFCQSEQIDMVVIGPEGYLVGGLRDFLLAHVPGLAVIGPGKAGAQLEGSKDFSKAFMRRHQIPTAKAFTVNSQNLEQGIEFISALPPPYVLKADGLAAGKGVIIEPELNAAIQTLQQMVLSRKFGSDKVLVEEFLSGVELSVFVLTDGKSYCLLPTAKDYKRIGEGDTGPNTGGMGAVSPVPFASPDFMQKVKERIIEPTIAGLHSEGIPYLGFIYFGLMAVGGEPYVIEYNARMGDPETQAVMPRIESDLLELFVLATQGKLAQARLLESEQCSVAIVLASQGYPGAVQTGKLITGWQQVEGLVFHAGTQSSHNQIFTHGGRVLAAVGLGDSLPEARNAALKTCRTIEFEGKYFRSDIGLDLMS